MGKFTQEEIETFKAYEEAGDMDAKRVQDRLEPVYVLLFSKHFPKFRPTKYCQWRNEQDGK
jgi:hypothetical protein